MGQQLFKVQVDLNDNNTNISNTISSDDIKDDVSFFFPQKSSGPTLNLQGLNNDQHISNLQTEYIQEIRNHLFRLTKSTQWEELNTEINEKFIDTILTSIIDQNKKVSEEQNDRLTYKQQLQTSLTTKLNDDKNINISFFTQSSNNSMNNDEQKSKQLSYFAIQSLTSILLILIKSTEKNDPTIVHQILTLANQLCEQLPMKFLSSTNNFLFKSLEPLTNYIQELSVSSNPIFSKQTIQIQLCFFISKGSFKELLPLLSKLIFNTNDIYNIQSLFCHVNTYLTEAMTEYEKAGNSAEFLSLNYLKSINSFPNSELIKLNPEVFTGQFISSVILSHIDIENEIDLSTKQFKLNSISCEFHSNTFKDLFNIIEQLTKLSQSNNTTNHLLMICLRLFTTHLQFLSDLKSNISDLTIYATNDEFKKWFDLLLNLSSNKSLEQIAKEASKALIHVIDIQSSTLIEKFDLIHQYILKNKYSILIEQLLIELNKNELLFSWMEALCDENTQMKSLEILYSFINLYFTREDKQKSQIKEILFSFQQLVLSQLIIQCETKNISNKLQLSNLITHYLTYIFKHYTNQKLPINDFLNLAIIGLCLMTDITKSFVYEDIQPIFISILPLLTEYYLQNLNNEDNEFLTCLIGKMSHVLIIGLPQDSLEIKHLNKFKQPIFAGGCVINKTDNLFKSSLALYSQFQSKDDNEDDKEFLMSIYNNTDKGAELISKLILSIKDKQRPLQKSIEQQANDACAALFAVYIKYYRRMNLAKSELLRTDENKPYSELLSIYEYANRIQTLFATVKGQGGDCNEVYKQIKMRTLFLLLSVKESDMIPIIKEDLPSTIVDTKAKTDSLFQRQRSQWTKARTILKLLKNLFQACIRFKKFMLEKKQNLEQKYDYESLLNRSIENFIYGDFYKSSTVNEEKQLETDELEKCLHRQHQRAIIRLITYQFSQKFIQNILNANDNGQSLKILSIYLPYLRKTDIDWSYFNDIQASNNQLKNEISNTYYSISKLILSSTNLTQNIFSLLNISYESIDISYLHHYQIIETLFNSFISLIKKSEGNLSLQLKLIAFNWFRLFVFKLCENIEIENLRNISNQILQQQQKFVFNTLIFNEIKSFKEHLVINSEEQNKQNSLKNLSLEWFLQPNQSMVFYINQYLTFLLRSMYFYKQVLVVCANIDYLQEFLYIYYHNQSKITHLLIIKILRYLIPYISDDIDDISKNLIEKFLLDTLKSIGDNDTSKEILSELIYLYRRIISVSSSWQILATEFVFNSIKSYLNEKSVEKNNSNDMNQLLASLSILGGYIQSYRLGSIVKIENNDELLLAIILNIDETEKPYLIQYLQTNQIESVSIDQLQHEIDIFPPNLLDPNDSILDILGSFIQIDTSVNNKSLILLELKRRSISVLSHLLKDKKLIEIFMNKPYASILAKLSKLNSIPKDLGVVNKQNLEEYSLSLDTCKINEENSQLNKMTRNQLIIDALSPSINGWKPYVSQDEMTFFKQGRIGREEISVIPVTRETVTDKAFEECGVKHRFRGRVVPNEDNASINFPSFIIDNLQLGEGNWYYCVRLPVGGCIQMGWATNGFSPGGYSTGVGDDKYSWSYDGSRAGIFHAESYYSVFDNVRWTANDVCGCGIEVNGKNTRVKYWLNGKFLGTAFTHDSTFGTSSTVCDLLPNGPKTTYFPALSINWNSYQPINCEFIVSPEDMQACPLPYGYKPVLLPKLVETENSIVDYPFNAYLIGENSEDFLVNTRNKSEKNTLRDFVHEEHIETTFNLDNHYLNLPDTSDGFPLSFDNNENSSITISFDYQILSTDDELDLILFKLNSTEIPIQKKVNEKQQCVINLLLKERQIKVYINTKYQIFNSKFPDEKLNLHILPRISAQIHNLAIWKYTLSEEQISRLYTYGLFYINTDYHELKNYRKRVNTISFSRNQKEFSNESLLPLDEPFTKEIWEQKKKQANNNESKYFKSHENMDYSTIELFGNKTYLVLNKSNEEWCNYSLVLNISIPQCPIADEKLTLITLNSKSELYITSNGKLWLKYNEEKYECTIPIVLNEYFRLFISVHEQSIKVYINNNLQIDLKVSNDCLQIKSNRIDLFKQTDLKDNISNDDKLRISFKSITYLNRTITLDELQSSKLIKPSVEIIAPSLIAMGYKKHWIESVIEKHNFNDIATILHEQKQEFINIDLENERKRYVKIFSKLNSSNNLEVIENIIKSSQFHTYEQIKDVSERIFTHSISSKSIEPSLDTIKLEENWFSQSTEGLGVSQNMIEWLRDETVKSEDEDNIYQLIDLTQLTTKKPKKSIEYSHKNLSSEQYLKSRIDCEHGLMAIYARSTIVNMLKIWSNDDSTLFPLEKFEDYSILKLIDYTQINKNEKIDRIYSLIKSILKTEIQHLLDHTTNNDLQNQVPLFYYLQKDIMTQLIQFLFKSSLINKISEQQINLNFILTILNLFIELLSDKFFLNQTQINLIISTIFPISLINLIFHLFLLIPTNQLKISILHLFNNLLRLSESIVLNTHIQQFFIQLLIDLSSDKILINNNTKKKFQIPLTDIIYKLLLKENTQLKEYQPKLPTNIQDLFITIDVINAWIDPSKQKVLPIKFIEKSTEILGDTHKINQEDFEKSNKVFNIPADRELINFMNDQSAITSSFTEFIQTIPTESEPNPTFYKNHLLLANIPADCVQIRARFIYLLNKYIGTNLSAIDFNLPSEQSFLTDQIRKIKFYLLSCTKTDLFNESLQKTETPYSSDWSNINFDTVKASTDIEKSENTMFYQAYQQLYSHAHIIFRRPNEQLWHAQYLGMHSTDGGGPYRDSITRICLDICSTRLSLFILCPNGRTNSGLNRDCWIPNVFPLNKSISIKIQKQYRFVGQLMGMAIRRKHYLDIKFPRFLWKQLLNEQITVEDIEAIDIQSFTIINEMENNVEQIKSMNVDEDVDSLFSSIMNELRFDVVSSSGQTYELVPGGKDIPIMATNFKQYCVLYRQYRLNEFNRQIDFIRQGLYSIIPWYYLSLFTANELEESVCGKGRIDIEILKRNTYYGGDFNQSTPVIERFWKVLNESFTDEQKKLFLIFVWGRSTLPTRDEDFQSKFVINSFDVYEGDVDKALPRSHTCYFTLDLPAYTTTDIMYDRLNYAIASCSSIDGDGTMNEAADTGHIVLDETAE